MSDLRHAVVVRPLSSDDGGGYAAIVPDLPGCMADGDTPEQALGRAEVAIASWIEAAQDLGHPVPEPSFVTAALPPRAA